MRLIIHRADGQPATHDIYTWDTFPLRDIMKGVTVSSSSRGRFYDIPCAFDIETTSYKVDENIHFGFMYHWQFCIDSYVVFGRTWEEFQNLIRRLGSYASGVCNFVIYVHNLAFEWQFFHQFLKVTDIFARKKGVPLYFRSPGIEWRCSYFLTNMSLALATSSTPGVKYWKKVDKYDYKKIRTAITDMTPEELEYCFCDVYGLCEVIRFYMKTDTLASIPLTSTGFVRREVRAKVLENKKNQQLLKSIRLIPDTYLMCKEAFRGGDTSCNALWANQVLEDIDSYDMQSSYPAVMVSEKFPMTPFKKLESINRARFYNYISKFACLFRVVLSDVELKDNKTVPYLDLGHCRHTKEIKTFNGRVLSATRLEVTFTDIDWTLFDKEYNYDTENVRVLDFYYSRYGYLPDELRQYVIDMFKGKCELKKLCSVPDHDPELDELYMKYKNRINALFGMMVTDICSPTIYFENEEWQSIDKDIPDSLTQYYANRKSFLSYQWGVWVTAHARKRLREGMYLVGNDEIYNDTDSVKTFIGYEKAFKELSDINIEKIRTCGLDAIPVIDGKSYYLGEWEKEEKHGGISRFRSCGAKKYCTEYNDGSVEITVAGCNKIKGSEYVKMQGGVDAFIPGVLQIPHEYSGRMTAWYITEDIHTITIDGCTMTTASSIYMENTTYMLGITDEYEAHIHGVQNYDFYMIKS